jgi:hypothetical protein
MDSGLTAGLNSGFGRRKMGSDPAEAVAGNAGAAGAMACRFLGAGRAGENGRVASSGCATACSVSVAGFAAISANSGKPFSRK